MSRFTIRAWRVQIPPLCRVSQRERFRASTLSLRERVPPEAAGEGFPRRSDDAWSSHAPSTRHERRCQPLTRLLRSHPLPTGEGSRLHPLSVACKGEGVSEADGWGFLNRPMDRHPIRPALQGTFPFCKGKDERLQHSRVKSSDPSPCKGEGVSEADGWGFLNRPMDRDPIRPALPSCGGGADVQALLDAAGVCR